MFVEKLSKEDIVEYLKEYEWKYRWVSLGEIQDGVEELEREPFSRFYTHEQLVDYLINDKWKNKKVYYDGMEKEITNFKRENGKITFNTRYYQYEIRDFGFLEQYLWGISPFECNNTLVLSWLQFMYSKFGEDYEKSFLKFRESQKSTAIKAAEDRYDTDTKAWASRLNEGQGK